jgi:hypothetical protein
MEVISEVFTAAGDSEVFSGSQPCNLVKNVCCFRDCLFPTSGFGVILQVLVIVCEID